MKRILAAIFIVSIILSAMGCKNEETDFDKPQIYTSFYALYDFASEIAGENADIYNMVPPGIEPHDWEPTVQDMAKLNYADAVLYNGLGMDNWVEKIDSSFNNSDLRFINTSDGVDTKDYSDPHIWLDPENVKIICSNILSALCEIDPVNSTIYKSNYNSYAAQLDELNEAYKAALKNYENKSIVVSHSAFGYLCDAYNINQQAIEGISAESEPSPERMMELINFIKENNIKYIFCENLVSHKPAQTLADETGAELLSLSPFEGLTEEEISRGENYISVMYENLENLDKALGE